MATLAAIALGSPTNAVNGNLVAYGLGNPALGYRMHSSLMAAAPIVQGKATFARVFTENKLTRKKMKKARTSSRYQHH